MFEIKEINNRVFSVKNNTLKLSGWFSNFNIDFLQKDIKYINVKTTSNLFHGCFEIHSIKNDKLVKYVFIYQNDLNDEILMDFKNQFLKLKE